MKASDFVEGNWIYHNWVDHTGKANDIIQVEGHFKNCVIVDSNMLPEYERINELYIKPIPINKQWFLSFGFKSLKCEITGNNDRDYVIDKWIQLSKISGNTNLYQVHLCGKAMPTEIMYVHQLQNIYLALTEKKLIKRS